MLIVCNGMVRSGSTLQYNLVRNLVEEMCLGKGEGFFRNYQLSVAHLQGKLSQWGDDDKYHVIKNHFIHPKIADMVTDGSAKMFYIYRDIRDVAVSAKIKCKHQDNKLIAYLDQAISIYEQVKGLPNVIWDRYENVYIDIPTTIQKYARVLNLEPTPEIIDKVTQNCSLENTQEVAQKQMISSRSSWLIFMLKKIGFKVDYSLLSSWNKQMLIHPDHISKNRGGTNLWHTQLSRQEIDIISKRYRAWLLENKYLQ